MRFNSTVAGLLTLHSGEVIFFSPLAKSNSKCQSILQKFFVVVQSYHPLVSSFISISLSSAVTSAILSTHSHCLLSLLISIWPIRQILKWLLLPAHREAAIRCAQAHLLHHNSRHSPNILFFFFACSPSSSSSHSPPLSQYQTSFDWFLSACCLSDCCHCERSCLHCRIEKGCCHKAQQLTHFPFTSDQY